MLFVLIAVNINGLKSTVS